MVTCTGYAATSAEAPLGPFIFERRDPGRNEISAIETADARLQKSDVKDRFVNDMASLARAA